MTRTLPVIALLLLCGVVAKVAAQQARVSMSASDNRVTVGEPFAIEIRADITGGEAEEMELPDFGKLEVLGRRESRPFSFSFGFGSGGQHARVQSQVIYSFTLRAREAGTFRIQPAIITVAGRKFASQPLAIEASGSALPSPPPSAGPPGLPGQPGQLGMPDDSARTGAISPPLGPLDGARFDPNMFVRTVVDKKRAYVGEQVTVTVYLYLHGSLQQSPSVTQEPTTEGFWVHDLLPPQRALAPVRQDVKGRGFNVYVLRRFAAFPLRAGTLEVGATALETGGGGSLFDLLTGPSKPTQRTGIPVQVEVLALPARAVGAAPSHVGSIALEATLDPASAKVGDALTLQVTARGIGNLKALKLGNPVIDGVEVLAPEVEDRVTSDLDQVGGERVFRWLLLPRAPGAHEVKPFAVDVFDPAAAAFSTVRSPALMLSATGAASSTPEPRVAEQEKLSEAAPRFGPPRTVSSLRRATPSLYLASWFPWAVLAGPLGVLLLLGGRTVNRRLASRKNLRSSDQAFRDAQAKLESVRPAPDRRDAGEAQVAYSAIASALKGALQARLGEPIGGLTLSSLRAHLVARGMGAPLAERLVNQLEAAELARFDPLGHGANELATALEKARGTLRELERFTPREAA